MSPFFQGCGNFWIKSKPTPASETVSGIIKLQGDSSQSSVEYLEWALARDRLNIPLRIALSNAYETLLGASFKGIFLNLTQNKPGTLFDFINLFELPADQKAALIRNLAISPTAATYWSSSQNALTAGKDWKTLCPLIPTKLFVYLNHTAASVYDHGTLCFGSNDSAIPFNAQFNFAMNNLINASYINGTFLDPNNDGVYDDVLNLAAIQASLVGIDGLISACSAGGTLCISTQVDQLVLQITAYQNVINRLLSQVTAMFLAHIRFFQAFSENAPAGLGSTFIAVIGNIANNIETFADVFNGLTSIESPGTPAIDMLPFFDLSPTVGMSFTKALSDANAKNIGPIDTALQTKIETACQSLAPLAARLYITMPSCP